VTPDIYDLKQTIFAARQHERIVVKKTSGRKEPYGDTRHVAVLQSSELRAVNYARCSVLVLLWRHHFWSKSIFFERFNDETSTIGVIELFSFYSFNYRKRYFNPKYSHKFVPVRRPPLTLLQFVVNSVTLFSMVLERIQECWCLSDCRPSVCISQFVCPHVPAWHPREVVLWILTYTFVIEGQFRFIIFNVVLSVIGMWRMHECAKWERRKYGSNRVHISRTNNCNIFGSCNSSNESVSFVTCTLECSLQRPKCKDRMRKLRAFQYGLQLSVLL
jgi:hypothetical protein